MERTIPPQAMARRPLTERAAQGRTQQPGRRMEGSGRRAYGKGGTASSRAVLSDHFLDENEIEDHIAKMNLGQVASPSPSKNDAKPFPPAPTAFVARKAKHMESVPAFDSEAARYTSPLLLECHKPKGLCDFSRWAERVAEAFRVVKVAEGSYGEVFKLERKHKPSCRATTMLQQDLDAYGGCIFKLIPLRAKSSTSTKQTSLDALIREVKILKRMDPIPGFTRFRDITVLQGAYPPSFTEAYYNHRALKRSESHNPLPSKYSGKQLWAMIEMDDGGTDLEILQTPSAYQVFDIFWLTCCTLSYAEELAEFEHRDLHIGNICIKSAQTNNVLDISPRLNMDMKTHELRPSNFGYSGLRTTIIDYTLSRAKDTKGDDDEKNSKSTIIFDPMKMVNIFKQIGQTPEQSIQFATYRKMRAYALASEAQSRKEDPSRENKKKDKWARFLPKTNVMWLECLLWTLLYRSKERVLTGSDELTEALQERIYAILKKVLVMIDGTAEGREGGEAPKSAGDVLRIAHKERLLTEQDLVAIRAVLQ